MTRLALRMGLPVHVLLKESDVTLATYLKLLTDDNDE